MKATTPFGMQKSRSAETICTNIFTNLMAGMKLTKHNDSLGLEKTRIYSMSLDPSVKGIVKRMERWAMIKGLAMSVLLTTGLFFAVRL